MFFLIYQLFMITKLNNFLCPFFHLWVFCLLYYLSFFNILFFSNASLLMDVVILVYIYINHIFEWNLIKSKILQRKPSIWDITKNNNWNIIKSQTKQDKINTPLVLMLQYTFIVLFIMLLLTTVEVFCDVTCEWWINLENLSCFGFIWKILYLI